MGYAIGTAKPGSGSAGRPLSNKKRKELEEDPSAQIDTDADSTKKNGTWHFGYKSHIGVDAGSKLIRRVSYTKASPHDPAQLGALPAGDASRPYSATRPTR